jgi:hypothetical protein
MVLLPRVFYFDLRLAVFAEIHTYFTSVFERRACRRLKALQVGTRRERAREEAKIRVFFEGIASTCHLVEQLLYLLLIKLMVLTALMELGMNFTYVSDCRFRHCLWIFERRSRDILNIEWKPISVFPEEARRFQSPGR